MFTNNFSVNFTQKLKNILNQEYVSLIGESWGGIVALKVAQILESQGIMVTVSLIDGDPEILIEWSKIFLSNENYINKLKNSYHLFYKEVFIYILLHCILFVNIKFSVV